MLHDDAHLVVQRVPRDRARVAAVDQHAPLIRQIEPGNQVDDRSFPGSGVTDQGDCLPRLRDEADGVQHGTGRIVAERQVFKLDPRADGGQPERIFWFAPVGRRVEQVEDPFGAGHRRQSLVVLVPEHLNRVEKDVRQEEELNQIAAGHVNVGIQDAVAADQQQRGNEKLAVEFQERQKDPRRADRGHVVSRVIAHQIVKQPPVQVLADECLRDTNAAHRFGKRRGDPAEAFLHVTVGPAQPAAEVAVEPPDHRRHRGDDGEHHDVVIQHEAGRNDHLAQPHQRDEQHVLHADAHGLAV